MAVCVYTWPSVWHAAVESDTIELILRSNLNLFCFTLSGSFLRMSCVKSSNRNMLCDLCNEKAVTRCPYCKTAQYCGAEHRKSDFKLHKKKCMGLPSVEKEQQFRLNGYTPMDLLPNRFFERAEFVVDTLRKQGYCYLDDFHGEDIALKILSEVKNLHQREKFTDGELVSSNGNGSMLNKKIRDDKIAWIDGKEENCQAISHHMTTVNTLIRFCNGLIEEYDIEHRTKVRMISLYTALCSNAIHYSDVVHMLNFLWIRLPITRTVRYHVNLPGVFPPYAVVNEGFVLLIH